MTPTLHLKSGKEERLLRGSLWVFRNELDLKEKDFPRGCLVRLATAKGRPLGLGLINTQSTIAVRVLCRAGEFEGQDVETILKARLDSALDLRRRLFPGAEGLRLVFSEGDGLSGLVADRFGDALVVQFQSLAMDQHRDLLLEGLKQATGCRAVVERSEGPSREKEGLLPAAGLLWAAEGFNPEDLKTWKFKEGPWTFQADLLHGQKTGFFLDQRDSRAALAPLAKGRECLNAFCYTGAFSVALAWGGAGSVLGLDASQEALDLAAVNARLNGLEGKCVFEKADAFKRLREMEKEGRRFGLVLLDPPALAKSREGLEGALRGYKEINYRSLKLLAPGGILATCSCTQMVDEERFLSVLQAAAKDASCGLKVIYRGGQPADHPWLAGMEETRYLKVFAMEKV
jgi:23S rRNA (cytosine1962-C5)-methyltransferase